VAILFANPPHLVSALRYFDICVTFKGSPLSNVGTLFCQSVILHLQHVLFTHRSLRAFAELFPAADPPPKRREASAPGMVETKAARDPFAPPKRNEALLLGTAGTRAYRDEFVRRAVGIEGVESGSVCSVPDTHWNLRVVHAPRADRIPNIPEAIIFTAETLEDGYARDARKCFDDWRSKRSGILMILAVETPRPGGNLGELCQVATNHWQVLRLLAQHPIREE
jgi:hypothetical protein